MISFTPVQSFYLFCAYLVAALPFGVIISLKVAGKDVRDQGSGNTGATNVSRLMGKKWGVVVLILDALKGFVVVWLSKHYGSNNFVNLVAILAVAAHCWPLYLGFKGGKGVATALGVLAALSPVTTGIAGCVFLAVFLLYRRTSGGSISAALALPVISFLYPTQMTMTTACCIALIVCWKHRENIVRIWRNEEPRFF